MEDEKVKESGMAVQVSDLPDQIIEPTAEDWKNLREVADTIPTSAFLIILIEFCERFTFYGLSGPFQNYIQQPPPPSCKSTIKSGAWEWL